MKQVHLQLECDHYERKAIACIHSQRFGRTTKQCIHTLLQ